jgi:hypothetical protein
MEGSDRDKGMRAEPIRAAVILVSGASAPTEREVALAEETGRLLAEAGAIVLTGGMGGVMEAASRGASERGGRSVAVLPGRDATESPPNRYVEIAIYTGMSEARNAILAHTADGVIAIGGGWGTLSEIALARRSGRPVVGLATWIITPPGARAGEALPRADDPAGAVGLVLAAIAAQGAGPQGAGPRKAGSP